MSRAVNRPVAAATAALLASTAALAQDAVSVAVHNRQAAARRVAAELAASAYHQPTEAEALAARVARLSVPARSVVRAVFEQHRVPAAPALTPLPTLPDVAHEPDPTWAPPSLDRKVGEDTDAYAARMKAQEQALLDRTDEQVRRDNLEAAKRQPVPDDTTGGLAPRWKVERRRFVDAVAAASQRRREEARALADAVDFFFAGEVPALFVPYAHMQVESRPGSLQRQVISAFAQAVEARVAQAEVLVFAWGGLAWDGPPPPGYTDEEWPGVAIRYAALKRAEEASAMLAKLGIPSTTVIPDADSAFHLRWGSTPGYRREVRVDQYVPAKYITVDDFLERQGVLLVLVDKQLGGLLAADVASTAPPAPAPELGDAEARRQLGSREAADRAAREAGFPPYEASPRALRLEQAAFDVCNAVTAGNYRYNDGQRNAWEAGAVLTLQGDRPVGSAADTWPREVLDGAFVPPTTDTFTLQLDEPTDVDWLAPWHAAVLLGEHDTLVPRDATLAGGATGAVTVEVRVQTTAAKRGRLRVPVENPITDNLLRLMLLAVEQRGELVSTTRLGALEFRDMLPAALGQVRRVVEWSVVDAGTPRAGARGPDAALREQARATMLNLARHWLARLDPVVPRQDPLHHGWELVAEEADMEVYDDLTAAEELSRARRWLAAGLYPDLASALQATRPLSRFGTCVNRVLNHGQAERR